ncbi:YqcI/YcgG family protein [Streptomyces sp. NPDC001816]|uniref:YqcI/YcgG family protein n=1 Tax=Streptomyces sp. NPDC001816 TaxID=3364612 RepID=UPI003693602E
MTCASADPGPAWACGRCGCPRRAGHPGASRPSRRFALPALVFDSHLQFNALGRTFFKMRKKIRERDDALYGTANPSLLTYRDEARHYSGRMTEQTRTCPFTARTGG